MYRKQEFIDRSQERLKKMKEKQEQRKLEKQKSDNALRVVVVSPKGHSVKKNKEESNRKETPNAKQVNSSKLANCNIEVSGNVCILAPWSYHNVCLVVRILGFTY